jgi:hypothetical protein
MLVRANLLIAANKIDGDQVKSRFPQFSAYLIITPRSLPSGIRVGEYVWTPRASIIPARLRMAVRVALAPMIDEESVEETFPVTLLSW